MAQVDAARVATYAGCTLRWRGAMLSLTLTYLLLASLGLALVVVLVPSAVATRWLQSAGGAQSLALVLDASDGIAVPGIAALPLGLAGAALVPGVFVARSFGRVDMVAVLFHRDFGLKGATLAGLWPDLVRALLACLLVVLAVIGLEAQLGWGPVVPVAATALLLAANPFLRHGVARLLRGPVASVLPERLVAPVLVAGTARPDLLILYLEGLDQRFWDRRVYGSLAQKLEQFARDGIRFTNVGQIAGTGWSMAGMTATQSGVPITPRGLRLHRGMETLDSFMPGVTFLGDILAAKGYRSAYVVGGDSDFGGIAAMYRSHGIDRITDLEAMRGLVPAADFAAARVSWYVDDQMTFATAEALHRELEQAPDPFALIVETIGPHGPKGILSRQHTPDGRAALTLDVARAAACLVDDALAFVDRLRQRNQARGRDLRIVLLSDHLNHAALLPRGAAGFAGRNTVILSGAPGAGGRVIDKPGSMIDVFPTLLDWLGWAEGPAVAAGLGRSLLASAPTLVQEFGIPRLDAMITGDARLAARLWGPARTP